jgi:eukaryotic-like serine/threonine-protein kinase
VGVGEQHISHYRLQRVVMTGQTSQIWEARDDNGGRRVAIKALLSNFRKDKEQTGYLRHEWEVGQPMDHPRVVKMYELVEQDGAPALVMELFEGVNLKQGLTNVGFEALAPAMPLIVQQMCEGLAYFHKAGWIHRDVKPDNFMCSDTGDVKLIDFALAEKKRSGFAKLFGGKSKVQGTRSYMSPEQIRGQSLDHRSDLYSLGCTIFQLLCGTPPFTGSNPNDVLQKHLTLPPPSLESQNANITPEFSKALAKALQKKPEARPEGVDQLLREIKAVKMFKKPPK